MTGEPAGLADCADCGDPAVARCAECERALCANCLAWPLDLARPVLCDWCANKSTEEIQP